ncbi:RNA-directed DNA polymerase, eukaryota, reverse transcriptase zinc-binding domain protein [Tanacetum coccineum]
MPYSEHHHSPKLNSEVPKEDSNSFSKPPSFEAYNSSSKISSSRKNHVSPKQPSHFSSAPAKTSCVSKSQSKPLNNHGSMIEAFVSYIEMGKVLGYDMEGSKNDLKKFIDSLGANQGHVLDCHISDHRPILLTPMSVNFGPTPFKFYNSWLLDKNLHSSIIDFWDSYIFTSIGEQEDLIKKINNFDANLTTRLSDIAANDQRSIWIDNLCKIELNESIDSSQKAKSSGVSSLGSPFYKSLSSDQNTFLDSSVSVSEIKNAIWDCGSDKSPGPDGFTFAFFKEFWNMLKSDVVDFVQHFFNSGTLPRGCNTSFITLILKVPNPMVVSDFRPISLIGAQYKIIAKVLANRLARVIDTIISQEQSAFIKHRQILDGPLMVNEVIQWCKRKKSKLMVFKIDFEKAFDSISWDFLLRVMHFMGFSDNWIKWISGCLNSATSSILINGLHVAMEDAMAVGLYNGFKINTLNLSRLFFADDALFIGEWSRNNIKSLVAILDCFHKVSGLKINYHKSKLFGVGVPFDEVSLLASITGCNALVSPFNYLGLPIDYNMALVEKLWEPFLMKFSNVFPIGKHRSFPLEKLETLRSKFFWGSVDNSNKIPWISWNVALAPKDKGGLGIGSLYSLNHALIQKWRWRFLNNPHALWSRLIVAVHRAPNDRRCQLMGPPQNLWHEFLAVPPFKFQFPRLFRLSMNKDCLVSDCWNNGWHLEWVRNVSIGSNATQLAILQNTLSAFTLNDYEDAWVWTVDSPTFMVKSARCQIDRGFLPDDGPGTRWNNLLPKKINIFIWRTLRDRLPSRWNLSRKGIEVNSLNCPICDKGIDSAYHTLWVCSLATTVWIRVLNWMDLHPPSISNLNGLYTWVDGLHMSHNKKAILEVICGVVLWSLWRFRNEMIFGTDQPKRSLLFDNIVDYSFRWRMNKKGAELSKSEVIKEESKEEVQEEDKDEERTRKRKKINAIDRERSGMLCCSELGMEKYQDWRCLKVDKVLWGDLMVHALVSDMVEGINVAITSIEDGEWVRTRGSGSTIGLRRCHQRAVPTYGEDCFRNRIHGNVTRFHRPKGSTSSHQPAMKVKVRRLIIGILRTMGMGLLLVLDDSCVQNSQDYSCCLNGKVKEVEVLENLKVALGNEGFTDIDLRYMGGLWVMIAFDSVEAKEKFLLSTGVCSWFSQLIQASSEFTTDERVTMVEIEGIPLKVWNENTFIRIASKWGTLLNVENLEKENYHCKRLCVLTKSKNAIKKKWDGEDTLFETLPGIYLDGDVPLSLSYIFKEKEHGP